MNISTPGVYVEEMSLLPPSVAQVATAIPAFLGYTEITLDGNGIEIQENIVIQRIDNFKDYVDRFGETQRTPFTVEMDGERISPKPQKLIDGTSLGTIPEYLMYYSLKMYFDNGGGSCYIVSVGKHGEKVKKENFEEGLAQIKKVDEPTLLVLVDAVHLGDDYYDLCKAVLSQCGELKDRFGIFDVLENDTDASAFRQGIGMNQLKYGAAYTPYLRTGIKYLEGDVLIPGIKSFTTDNNGLLVVNIGSPSANPSITLNSAASEILFSISQENVLTISGVGTDGKAPSDLTNVWNAQQLSLSSKYQMLALGDEKVVEEASLTEIFVHQTSENGLIITFQGDNDNPRVRFVSGDGDSTASVADGILEINNVNGVKDAKTILGKMGDTSYDGYTIQPKGDGADIVLPTNEISLIKGVRTHENGLFVRDLTNDSGIPSLDIKAEGGKIIFKIIPNNHLTIDGLGAGQQPDKIVKEWKGKTPAEKGGFELIVLGDGSSNVTATGTMPITQQNSLADLENTLTQTYNRIKRELDKQRVVLPPSSTIAGIYARVDRSRGVWKSPANESLNNVLEPIEKIDNNTQGRLNIDQTSGKSINAIRSFSGKGTLVWGGRTLAGNDNEWRYVNVRRLFILIEESIQKATGFVVFESNDSTTWLKVKALIESFLFGLWQQGALAGSTPEAAYMVNVGLGKTMTQQDVLEGRLIVQVGIAAVRPAEFIILKFYHRLQEE